MPQFTGLASPATRGRYRNEEQKVIALDVADAHGKTITAYSTVPQSMLSDELGEDTGAVMTEMLNICRYYKMYRDGRDFNPEGSNNDYLPADLHYKMGASLINKEARFLFAESPTITVQPRGKVGKATKEEQNTLTTLNDLLHTILTANFFEEALIKAAKDCFIGKRVAALVNFNEEDGVTITFMPATQFIFETKMTNPNCITKFVAFLPLNHENTLADRRVFKKKYELDDDGTVWLEEAIYDGAGNLINTVTDRTSIELDVIPACVFINDGLSGDLRGESEMRNISYYEKWYSRLSSADIDAQRKSMNPIKYSVDMDNRSTKNLSTGPGAFWDFGSDQNLSTPHPEVGMLEPKMNYSEALADTLNRLKTTGFEQVDMPNINLESMNGTFTSGKAIKALYWPLIVRCTEKMKMWGPQLANLMRIVIDGSYKYPNCVVDRYIDALPGTEAVDYEIDVENHVPIPEDEIEKKNMDLAEVASYTMSRKTYMKNWYNLTDDEVQAELDQIALERQIIEDSSFSSATGTVPSVPSPDQSYAEPRYNMTDNSAARDSNMPEGEQMNDTRNAEA